MSAREHDRLESRAKDRPDRANKHLVAAHFEIDAYRELKMAAAAELKGTTDVLNEALALWFKAHKRTVPRSIAARLCQMNIK